MRRFFLVAVAVTAVALAYLLGRMDSGDAPAGLQKDESGTRLEHFQTSLPDAGGQEHLDAEQSVEGVSEAKQLPNVEAVIAGEVEPWRKLRLDEADRRWQTLLDEREKGHVDFNSVTFFIVVCGRPVLDELGLGENLPQGVFSDSTSRNGEHILSSGGNQYRVPPGMVPAVDQYYAAWEVHRNNLAESKVRTRKLQLPSEDLAFPMDDELWLSFEDLKNDAKKALAHRIDPY